MMDAFVKSHGERAREDLLEPGPYERDGSGLVGKIPCEVPPEILSHYHGEKNPLKAIRARCLDCCCDQPGEVRKCVAVACPSWPFRMGTNPFRQRRTLSAEQKLRITERLQRTKECPANEQPQRT
jgi:hypothetical protein